jgi:hypothetical protein
LLLHYVSHCDERVLVTARCRVADVVLLVDACVDVLLCAAAVLLLAAAVVPLAVVLMVAALCATAGAVVVERVVAALWATSGAVVSVVATTVDVCWLPNASHPPIVPTTAAVAIADFSRAAICLRRAVSVDAMFVLLLFLA